jgi:hypothetical protein
MTNRTYIPPRRQVGGPAATPGARVPLRGLGTPPDCGPYYSQWGLPITTPAPGTITPPDQTAPPDNKERWHSFGSIVAPAPGTSLALITGASFTCPNGHQAKCVGLVVEYIGTGFVQGDATLLFYSLRLNGAQFIRDYAKIPNTLGDLSAGPWPVPAAIKLSPNDLLEVLVTVPGGSTIGTGGTNRVHGHILGYYWPNQ